MIHFPLYREGEMKLNYAIFDDSASRLIQFMSRNVCGSVCAIALQFLVKLFWCGFIISWCFNLNAVSTYKDQKVRQVTGDTDLYIDKYMFYSPYSFGIVFGSLLLSANIKRFSFSCMQDLVSFIQIFRRFLPQQEMGR